MNAYELLRQALLAIDKQNTKIQKTIDEIITTQKAFEDMLELESNVKTENGMITDVHLTPKQWRDMRNKKVRLTK